MLHFDWLETLWTMTWKLNISQRLSYKTVVHQKSLILHYFFAKTIDIIIPKILKTNFLGHFMSFFVEFWINLYFRKKKIISATFAFEFFGEFATEAETNGWSDKPEFVRCPSETGVQIFICVLRFCCFTGVTKFY